jgi:hypothetical protein
MRGARMRVVFNTVMRIVSNLIGLMLAAVGSIWILQGLNIAFLQGFMAGNYHWAIYGALVLIVGVAQVVWSNIRQTARSPD